MLSFYSLVLKSTVGLLSKMELRILSTANTFRWPWHSYYSGLGL